MAARTHYHIRWSGGSLDWKPFATSQEAEECARQIVLPGESYTCEEYDDACPLCQEFRNKTRSTFDRDLDCDATGESQCGESSRVISTETSLCA